MTQTELAQALQISIPTVSNAENEYEIHASTGRKLCEFLGIDIAEAVIPRSKEGNGECGDAA